MDDEEGRLHVHTHLRRGQPLKVRILQLRHQVEVREGRFHLLALLNELLKMRTEDFFLLRLRLLPVVLCLSGFQLLDLLHGLHGDPALQRFLLVEAVVVGDVCDQPVDVVRLYAVTLRELLQGRPQLLHGLLGFLRVFKAVLDDVLHIRAELGGELLTRLFPSGCPVFLRRCSGGLLFCVFLPSVLDLGQGIALRPSFCLSLHRGVRCFCARVSACRSAVSAIRSQHVETFIDILHGFPFCRLGRRIHRKRFRCQSTLAACALLSRAF